MGVIDLYVANLFKGIFSCLEIKREESKRVRLQCLNILAVIKIEKYLYLILMDLVDYFSIFFR